MSGMLWRPVAIAALVIGVAAGVIVAFTVETPERCTVRAIAEAVPASPPPPRRNARDGAEKEPLIQRAVEILGAQILRAPDGFGTASEVRSAPSADNGEEET